MLINLHRAIAAVAPISEVLVGDPNDRATWTVVFAPHATEAERETATKLLATIDLFAPTAVDVRAEASRRMQVLLGARDAVHLSQIIQNGQREAERLNTIRTGIPGVLPARDWTPDETARAASLWGADRAIEAIRSASNALEPNPPADYADNARWPS